MTMINTSALFFSLLHSIHSEPYHAHLPIGWHLTLIENCNAFIRILVALFCIFIFDVVVLFCALCISFNISKWLKLIFQYAIFFFSVLRRLQQAYQKQNKKLHVNDANKNRCGLCDTAILACVLRIAMYECRFNLFASWKIVYDNCFVTMSVHFVPNEASVKSRLNDSTVVNHFQIFIGCLMQMDGRDFEFLCRNRIKWYYNSKNEYGR